jgi:hypothetical protein
MLLLIAAFVWFVAGCGVASVGLSAGNDAWTVNVALGCGVVYLLFLALFLFISQKQITRIKAYTAALTNLFKFFDPQSYVIMLVMVGLGFTVRFSGMVPAPAIASFYSGLGAALITAAIFYVVNYVAVCEELTAGCDGFLSFIRKLGSAE